VHLLASSSLSGPVNLAGPTPATADRLMRYLARRSHRPYLLPAPRFALTLALGDAGRELLLASRRLSADRLLEDGFSFAHPRVNEAVDWAVDRAEHGF
jgi:NAD dependent epimerase/dehydratase family enzyme